MAKPKLKLRELTAEEEKAVAQLTRTRTASARMVERAKIIRLASQGLGISAIARQLQVSRPTVGLWMRRFNTGGIEGLQDEARPGRPATYTPAQVSEVIATALTDPQKLDLPFGSWTLDRLVAYLNEQRHLAIKRSRIGELLVAEGLRWRKQETWFGARVDPEFAKKRGRLRRSTPSRRRTGS
jgi:transposase